jgi:hypothetical protein
MLLDPITVERGPEPVSPAWRTRAGSLLRRLCELLRGTHEARIPF